LGGAARLQGGESQNQDQGALARSVAVVNASCTPLAPPAARPPCSACPGADAAGLPNTAARLMVRSAAAEEARRAARVKKLLKKALGADEEPKQKPWIFSPDR